MGLPPAKHRYVGAAGDGGELDVLLDLVVNELKSFDGQGDPVDSTASEASSSNSLPGFHACGHEGRNVTRAPPKIVIL